MSEELLKDLIGLKLKIVDRIIEELPESTRRMAKDMERSFLSAVHEATKDYSIKENKGGDEKSIKAITIE